MIIGTSTDTQLPQPGMHEDWKSWANALLVALQDANATAPLVTGSRGGNSALASLLSTLKEAGIIQDNTTV